MQEILNKRNYNAKHFLKEDGSKVLEAHAGHIHYKDGEEFKPLDWTLIFDVTKRGWGFSTHSFHPFFPEYSDGWAEFRDRFHDKDQTVRYKAIVQNIVKGELIETDETNPNFDDNIDNKGVLYRNAFGENRDYMLYNTRSSLVKVATVNNPNACTEDAVFEWEVEFPDKELFRVDKKEDAEEMTAKKTKTNTEDGKLVGYRLEKRDGKNVNTNKLTLIGNSKLDGKEWYTYLKSFKAWDSEGTTIEIVARISFVDGKAILKKTIPLAFLQSAVGRVFTDATTSYYVSGDKCVYNQDASWTTAKGASTGDGVRGGDYNFHHAYYNSPNYSCERTFLKFDTSGIGDTDTIDSATVYLYGFDNSGTGMSFNIFSSTAADTITSSDFGSVGSTAFCDSDISQASWSVSGYNSFSMNATGKAAISKTGNTKLSVRETTCDTGSSTPSNYRYTRHYGSAETGTSKDPYLSVTYTAGGGSTWTPKIIIF